MNAEFSLKHLILNFVFIGFLFFINKVGLPGNLICYGILILMALRSGPNAIKALGISTIILFANPYLIEIHPFAVFARFILLFAAALRILYDSQRFGINPLKLAHLNALIVFGVVCAGLSFLNNYYLTISLLKISTFVLGAYVLLLAADIYKQSAATLVCWFTSLSWFFILANGLAYVLGIAYISRRQLVSGDNMGMAGATSHPQTLGTLCALLAIFCLAVYFFTPYRMRKIAGLAIVPLLAICYLSAARTGFVAAILAIAFAVGLIFTPPRTRLRKLFINIKPVQAIGIGLALGACLLMVDLVQGGAVRDRVEGFLLKSVRTGETEAELSVDNVFSSRTALIEFSWNNFLDNPMTGIGFGTSYHPNFVENATLFSAPIEKGFFPTAILEETGIVGGTIFFFFLALLYRYCWKSKSIVGMIVLTTALLINLGEMVIFSLGGLGLIMWCLVCVAIIIGRPLMPYPKK